MTTWTPQGPPATKDARTAVEWAYRQFRSLSSALAGAQAWSVLHVAPEKPQVGQTYYADGTDWDPGAGEGLYVYLSSGYASLVTSSFDFPAAIHGAAAKSTPVDADETAIADSAASYGLKKITWASVKATLKTYFDTVYQPLSSTLTLWAGKTPPSGTVVGTTDTQTLSAKTLTGAKASTTFGVGGATPSGSGSGITFPATQSASTGANTLDDYEEGVCSMTLSALSGSITSSTVAAGYTKIGRTVAVIGALSVSNNGTGSGALLMDGLPFTPSDYGCGVGREVSLTGYTCSFVVSSGSTQVQIFTYNNTYPVGTGAAILFSIVYTTST